MAHRALLVVHHGVHAAVWVPGRARELSGCVVGRRQLVEHQVRVSVGLLEVGAANRAPGCHRTRYVRHARGWYAYGVRTVRGALGASCPATSIRTAHRRPACVARTYSAEAPCGTYASAKRPPDDKAGSLLLRPRREHFLDRPARRRHVLSGGVRERLTRCKFTCGGESARTATQTVNAQNAVPPRQGRRRLA